MLDHVVPQEADENTSSDEELKAPRGDARDKFVDLFKSQNKPWAKMNEREQENLVRDVNSIAFDVVAKTVRAVYSKGERSINGRISAFSMKDDHIELKINVARDVETATLLVRAASPDCLFVPAAMVPFIGERAPYPIEKDQPSLQLNEPAVSDRPTAAAVEAEYAEDELIYLAGRQAFLDEAPEGSNPHSLSSGAYEIWERGWKFEEAEATKLQNAEPLGFAPVIEARQEDRVDQAVKTVAARKRKRAEAKEAAEA